MSINRGYIDKKRMPGIWKTIFEDHSFWHRNKVMTNFLGKQTTEKHMNCAPLGRLKMYLGISGFIFGNTGKSSLIVVDLILIVSYNKHMTWQ